MSLSLPPASGPVLCFGEMLWDLLPHGAFPGGAPFNVACHLQQLGVPVVPVSAVGRDPRGDQLLALVEGRGIPAIGITRLADAPTGTVQAELTPSGDARYTIATGVAWDRIPVEGAVAALAPQARALVFGSLALRSPENQRTFTRLAATVPTSAWRVFDVNLRAPFDDLVRVRRYAPLANLLKLNSAEAARLARGASEEPGHEEQDARQLAAETGVPSALAYLALVVAAFSAWPLARDRSRPAVRALARGALAANAALFVAGVFEYNFGDVEILRIMLVVLALPFAAARVSPAPPPVS